MSYPESTKEVLCRAVDIGSEETVMCWAAYTLPPVPRCARLSFRMSFFGLEYKFAHRLSSILEPVQFTAPDPLCPIRLFI